METMHQQEIVRGTTKLPPTGQLLRSLEMVQEQQTTKIKLTTFLSGLNTLRSCNATMHFHCISQAFLITLDLFNITGGIMFK